MPARPPRPASSMPRAAGGGGGGGITGVEGSQGRAPTPSGSKPRAGSARPPSAAGRGRRSASFVDGFINPNPFGAATSNNGHSATAGGSRQRSSSRGGGGNNNTAGGGGGGMSERDYLEDQLRETLERQAAVSAAHTRSVVEYRHALRRCYDRNAVQRNMIAAARLRAQHDGLAEPGGGGGDGIASITDAEVDHYEMRRNVAVRQHDRLLHQLRRTAGAVADDRAVDAAARATMAAPLETQVAGATRSVFLRIRKMERKLNSLLEQHTTVNTVVRGYAAVLERLQAEARSYDGQMAAVERELRDRHRDHLQLVRLYKNAVRDCRRVAEEKERFTENAAQLRAAKEKALGEKKRSVEAALRDTRRQEHRSADLQRRAEEEAQLLDAAETVQAQLEQQRLGGGGGAPAAAAAGELAARSGGGDVGHSAEDEEKLAAYEKAFRHMLLTARVDTVDELVRVFERERQRQDELRERASERRAAAAALAAEVKALRARVSDERCCGLGAPTATAGLEREVRAFAGEEAAELRRLRAENQQMQAALAEGVTRANALAQKMSGYRPDVSIPAIRGPGDACLATYVMVLAQKVMALADDTVAATLRAAGKGKGTHAQDDKADGSSAALLPIRTTHVVIPENNVRVPLPRGGGGGGGGGGAPVGFTAKGMADRGGRRGDQGSAQQQQQNQNDEDGVDDSCASFHFSDELNAAAAAVAEGDGAAGHWYAGGGPNTSYHGRAPSTPGGTNHSGAAADSPLSHDSLHPGGGGGGGGRGYYYPAHGADGGSDAESVSSDGPLRREDLKHISAVIQAAERRRRDKENRTKRRA